MSSVYDDSELYAADIEAYLGIKHENKCVEAPSCKLCNDKWCPHRREVFENAGTKPEIIKEYRRK
jgi:hypothetical protein